MTTPTQPVQQPGIFLLRPYTILDLTRIYGVSKKTFRKWIKPFAAEIGERQGYYYTVIQVKIITDKLGLPTEIPLD